MHSPKYAKDKLLRERSSTSTILWDERHLKSLLGLRGHPSRLIQHEPWRAWIEQRGGMEHVLNSLCNGPLSPNQRRILNVILTHPDTPARFYANKLNISQSTYFVH